MTQQTNTINQTATEAEAGQAAAVSHMSQDLKNAVLIVSVVANLFVFTMWLMLQVTTQYDSQIASLLFNR